MGNTYRTGIRAELAARPAELGSPAAGGNTVWYYTNVDDQGSYGYIPASRVFTDVDPAPGLPHC
ncbi:hypothetical protein [Streptomyces sp. NPDC048462]|uniref:hypothetical protein n=1 Tax=Streptomyces sp. NPDC048462 TaxID=3365555 RepID=UPI003720FC33